MFSFNNQTILIISPHPDDEIFGAGGLIHKAKSDGAKVYVLYMTVGLTQDFSQKGSSSQDERIQEIRTVADFLDYDGWDIAFPGNEFHLQLDTLPQKKLIHAIERGERISLEKIQPTMILMPSVYDYNQDHRAIAHATITALRPQPPLYKSLQRYVLTYEYPPSTWSDNDSLPLQNFYVELTDENIEAKKKALTYYASQLKIDSGPLSVQAVETLAKLRGIQSGVPYAEAYTVKRFIA